MPQTLKITAVGNSVGVIMPKEVLEKLRVEEGDILYVTETTNGIELSRFNPDFARATEIAENVMREDRDVLQDLAK